jgi:hypothetical protein
MKDVRILDAVSNDLADAANWYDQHGHEGLGDRFLATGRESNDLSGSAP